MAQDIAFAGQVEIGVVGQVHRRGLIGHRVESNTQFVIVAQLVDGGDFRGAGITLVASDAQVSQDQAHRFRRVEGFGFPQLAVEAIGAAVQVIDAVVHVQLVGHAVQREAAIGDAVAIAANQRAEVMRLAEVGFSIVEAVADISQHAVAVRHVQFGDHAAKVADPGDHAVGVGQGVEGGFAAVRQFAKWGFGDGCLHVDSLMTRRPRGSPARPPELVRSLT